MIIATNQGLRRGLRGSIPLVLGVVPFGLVVGVLAQAKGLSGLEQALMSATVFAGASQILALEIWTDPAPILAATLAVLAVNLRFVLIGSSLAPWLGALRGWRRWVSIATLVDHAWALSIAEMRAGRHDALFYLGAALPFWAAWVVTTMIGHAFGSIVALPAGHPLFFAAPACFVALLVPIWRGRRDALPWALAAVTSLAVGPLLPNPGLAVITGALVGSLAGAVIEAQKPDAR